MSRSHIDTCFCEPTNVPRVPKFKTTTEPRLLRIHVYTRDRGH